ncbi:solute carrier organic anion transporter family member 4A1-like, partial [Diadema antillarum]|uniref:solute carrier organic anion transporter family member 4A1-like n=1 Tax=Diadema antillarum TaxID=105358 RepID=UPI003A873F97
FVERLTSISKVEHNEVVIDEATKFGWLGFRPNCVQFLNNPIGYCVMLCLVTLIQGMTAFGLVYISLTTIEKRFDLNSVQSGTIVSAYDFSTLFVAVAVSYVGERGHRPLWVGFGSMFFCAGSLVFAIPHFVTPNYVFKETSLDYCGLPNQTDGCSGDVTSGDSNLAIYYWVFVIAQVLHGIGAASLYTLGVTYIDENVPTRHFGIYMGIYNAVTVAGPAIGYIVGGAYLGIYTDLNTEVESLTIDQSSPLWVGAWWLGFIINAILLFIVTFIYLGFPKSLPGAEKVMEERKFETQKGSEFESESGALNRLKALPRATLTLVTNVPFMCLSAVAVVEFFFVAGLAVFGPKFLESQLSMSPSEAAYAMGLMTMTGGIAGALVAGIIMNRLDLKFPGLVKFCIVGTVFSLFCGSVFFAVCPTQSFSGVTVQYESTWESHSGPAVLNATCNSQCRCPTSYDPVCGSDGVTYYSACHAGCEAQLTDDGDMLFTNCRCVGNSNSSSYSESTSRTVESGTCPTSCPYRWLYYIAIFLVVFLGAMSGVAGWTAVIRCVSHSQRAYAMGLQTFMYGLLGSVPGPIVFGALIDSSCLLWETSCDGTGNCWLYDNGLFARSFLVLCVGVDVIAILFLIVALVSYKRPTASQVDSTEAEFASMDELDTMDVANSAGSQSV